MISSQETLIRNKITGVLLRQARLRAGMGVDECAATLSRDSTFIERAEEGREVLTLPQLESLARILGVPIQFLFGEQELPVPPPAPGPAYYTNLMTLRRKIVGVILQQNRLEAGQALDETAAVVGWEAERLRRVEWGEEPISLVELQALAEALGISLEAFIDPGEPVPSPEEPRATKPQSRATKPQGTRPLTLPPEEPRETKPQSRMTPRRGTQPLTLPSEESRETKPRGTRPLTLPSEESRATKPPGTRPLTLPSEELPQGIASPLAHLPVDVQEFVAKPINAPYLQVAISLSQMPAEILRRFASGLFEITY